MHLNWSNFKPESSGKPDEDAEAHLLCSNDWMNAHHFVDGVKVQRFCVTLLGEARLCYQSLEPINIDWQGLQNLFRQQYSKIGNPREQLFHAWRSFNFDENTETIDAYVTCIRQVTALLGYREPQILEVFKNALPTELYWILFPIEDRRQAVETANRILTKQKLEKQLTGQSSSSPFMSIRKGNSRRVSFDTREELGNKTDRLMAMIGKLAAKDSGRVRKLNPKYIRTEVEDKIEATTRELIRIDIGQIIDQIVEIENSSGKTEVDTDLRKVTGVIILEKIQEIMVVKTADKNIEMTVIAMIGMTEVGIGLEKGHFPEIMAVIELGVLAIVDQGQDLEQVQTGIE